MRFINTISIALMMGLKKDFYKQNHKHFNMLIGVSMSDFSEVSKHQRDLIKENQVIFQSLDVKNGEGLWVFGYGSLLWKVNFKYDEKVRCFIKGFTRRFWQSSTDHRGTVEKPGRVATLIPSEDQNAKLWGYAYHIPVDHIEESMDILNFREKGGYTLKKVKAEFEGDMLGKRNIEVLLYVADKKNFNYGGDLQLGSIAVQIFEAVGPSGPNIDYLAKLAETMQEDNLATVDDQEHTLRLYEMVKELVKNNNKTES